MSDSRPSNASIGENNLRRLEAWLDRASKIPERGGKANVSAIALAAGVDRQVLYRDEARSMIAVAVARVGLGMPEQQRKQSDNAIPAWAEQRIKNLEERIAVLQTEVHDLRSKVRRYGHIEQYMTDTGLLPR